MQVTTFIFFVLGVVGIAALIAVGATVIKPAADQPIIEKPIPGVTVTGNSLIRGIACQQDSDCTYVLNAYPIQRCISGNCPPPEDPNQPVQGDPAYTWINAYRDSCVNANDLQGQNSLGEPFEYDHRAATCTCEPIPLGPNGERTSLTGQKICKTSYVTS